MCRINNLILDTHTQSSSKPDANARTPKRARAACHFNALQAAGVRYVGANGVRHGLSRSDAKENPVKIKWYYRRHSYQFFVHACVLNVSVCARKICLYVCVHSMYAHV